MQPNIAIITYNTPHRKTQDVLFQLKVKNYRNVFVLALPFLERKPFTPIYKHRPSKSINVLPKELCKILDYNFSTINAENISAFLSENKIEFTLIAGAGLLPNNLVESHKIINTHPGWLPNVRGLDALKWAIHKLEILGVTTHFIDSEADAGLLIEQQKVPIYKNDTFHAVAYRQYEMEIEMLVNSIQLIPTIKEFKSLSSKKYEPTRRMPNRLEKNLLNDFEDYKKKFAI